MIGSDSPCSRLLWTGSVICTLFTLASCNSSRHPIVEGKVTVDGTPANSGNVYFTGADGMSVAGRIHADGIYRAVDVPFGPVKVAVVPLTRKQSVKFKTFQKTPTPSNTSDKRPVPIPKKYTDANSSGLTTTIKGGTNTYNIELSSK